MINYEKKNEYYFKNLVRYRNWIEQESLNDLYLELNRIILGNGAKKAGPLISCTHVVKKIGESIKLDFEVMVPIDNKIPLPFGFCFCEEFILKNVIDIHIITEARLFNEEAEKVGRYIKDNNILPKTATYSVLVSEDNEEINAHLIFGI